MSSRLWLYFALFILLVGLLARQGVLVAIGSLVLLSGGVARFWSRFSLEKVEYERVFAETRAFVGETIEVSLRVVNRKLLPLPWVEVYDQFPQDLPLEDAKLSPSLDSNVGYLTNTTSMLWYERVGWRHRLQCQSRGYYRVGPARLRSGDVFGLFIRERQDSQVDHLLVYPRVVPLTRLGLPSRRPFGETKGGERIFEDPSRFLGLRDYRPSDPPKRVDWKATARRQALQVKVFEPTVTAHLIVLLNISTFEVPWRGYDPVLLERAITVAASVAKHAFDEGCAVGLLVNANFPQSDQPVRIAPGRDPTQLTHILEALAMVMPIAMTPMEQIVERESYRLPLGSTLVMVTAIVNPPLLATLTKLREAGYAVVLLSVAEDKVEQEMGGITAYSVGQFLSPLGRELG